MDGCKVGQSVTKISTAQEYFLPFRQRGQGGSANTKSFFKVVKGIVPFLSSVTHSLFLLLKRESCITQLAF